MEISLGNILNTRLNSVQHELQLNIKTLNNKFNRINKLQQPSPAAVPTTTYLLVLLNFEHS